MDTEVNKVGILVDTEVDKVNILVDTEVDILVYSRVEDNTDCKMILLGCGMWWYSRMAS